MAMSDAILSPAMLASVKAKITAKNPDFDANIGSDLDWFIEAIVEGVSEEVIAHIVALAQVAGVVTVTSVSGVTTGPSASGPGAGTSAGTIT